MYLEFSPAFPPPPTFTPPVNESFARRGVDLTRRRYAWFISPGTMTDRIASPVLGPDQEYEKRRSARDDSVAQIRQDISARIRELSTDAVMMNEPLSPASVKDLVAFLSEIPFTKRPALYLLDNGNFRIVWKGADHEQAAFQFRGNNIVHCVFFFKRSAGQLRFNSETLVDLAPNVRQRYPSFAHLLNVSAA
jgi:hypothetical protein